jgi:hypothetical protein
MNSGGGGGGGGSCGFQFCAELSLGRKEGEEEFDGKGRYID